jgi:hypothetical protein
VGVCWTECPCPTLVCWTAVSHASYLTILSSYSLCISILFNPFTCCVSSPCHCQHEQKKREAKGLVHATLCDGPHQQVLRNINFTPTLKRTALSRYLLELFAVIGERLLGRRLVSGLRWFFVFQADMNHVY